MVISNSYLVIVRPILQRLISFQSNDKNFFLNIQSDIKALHTAAKKGDVSKVKEMISKNKRLIYARDSNGASAIHIAAREGHVDIIKYLTSENTESTKITDNVSSNLVT